MGTSAAANRDEIPLGIRALVVERDDASRIGKMVILSRSRSIEQVHGARGTTEAGELAAKELPHVAIIDASDHGAYLIDVVSAVRRSVPGVRIVLSSRCSTPGPASVRTAQAAAVVPPGASAETVTSAVIEAVTSSTANAFPAASVGSQPSELLTPGQREVLALLATGATNREIADQIQISPEAVKKRVSSLFRRLEVRNRTEATALAPHHL